MNPLPRLAPARLLLALPLVLAWSGTAAAQYTYQTVPAPANTYAYTINDSLYVAGYYNGSNQSFVRTPQANYSNFTYPNSTSTTLFGFNNNQISVGMANVRTQTGSTTVYYTMHNGAITNFTPPGGPVPGFNNNNQIAGYGPNGAGEYVGTPGGSYTSFNGPSVGGALGTLNDNGDTAGSYPPQSGQPFTNGYIRAAAGGVTTFNVPGSQGLTVTGLNNAGVLVASNLVAAPNYSQQYQGVVRAANGTLTTIMVPNSSNTYMGSINNNGVINGTAIMPNGTWVMFFAYPPGYTGPKSS